jgi:AAA15 family ATPase/GTPase
MIHYIKIANFGPILDEVELSFEAMDSEGSPVYEVEMPDGKKLLKLAYIYGPNASGKSSVLQAIDFLRSLWLNPAYNKDEKLNYDPFLFRPNSETYSSSIELSFYVDGIRHVYLVRFNKESVLSEKLIVYRSVKYSELFSRETDVEKRLSHVEFGGSVRGTSTEMNALGTATLHNNTVLGAFQKINVDLPDFEQLNKWGKSFLGSTIDSTTDLSEFTGYNISLNPNFAQWINAFLNRADKNIRAVTVKSEQSPQYEELLEFVKKIRPDDPNTEKSLRDFASKRQISFLHVMEGNEVYALPLSKESRGTTRYFGLGGILYQLVTQPYFTSVDELDTSLHADLMKYFLLVFLLNSNASQLLFTTHNLFLLEDQDFVRKDALWFTEKESNGHVALFSAADFSSDTLRKGASLINAYRSGRLGAKPNLGSPYFKAE